MDAELRKLAEEEARLDFAQAVITGIIQSTPEGKRFTEQAATFDEAFRLCHTAFLKGSHARAIDDMVDTILAARQNPLYEGISEDYCILEQYTSRAIAQNPQFRENPACKKAITQLAKLNNVYKVGDQHAVCADIDWIKANRAPAEVYRDIIAIAKTVKELGYQPGYVSSEFRRDPQALREGILNYYTRLAVERGKLTAEEIDQIQPAIFPYDPAIEEQKIESRADPLRDRIERNFRIRVVSFISDYNAEHRTPTSLDNLRHRFPGVDYRRMQLTLMDMVDNKELTATKRGKVERYQVNVTI
jgi:hypothetical protein